MVTPQWGPPPESKRAGQRTSSERYKQHAAMASALRARPGEWAMIGRDLGSLAERIGYGRGAWEPSGAFEATRRNCSGGKCDIYVRFVGEPDR